MVHLVTGYAGYNHIQSKDQGAFNSFAYGDGQYVAAVGNKFGASIIDNNTVRILDGEMLMYGRHIRIEPNIYEDCLIRTGTAGKNRVDLICMTYEKDATDGTEKAYLQVIQGSEVEGTAEIPSYTDGNILQGAEFNQMPLYKVNVEGVVLTSVEQLYQELGTYQGQINDIKDKTNKLLSGEAKTGNADKLDGHDSEYFATAKNLIEVTENLYKNNLLKNSNFALNTNGLSEYVNHVNMICVDEWKCEGASVATPLYPGLRIQHTSATSANLISQNRKDILPSVKGKTITISCKYSKRSLDDKFFMALEDGVNYATKYADNTATDGTLVLTTNIPDSATKLNVSFVKQGTSTTFTVDIEWVKLEIGSIATEYIARDIEVEKVLCGVADVKKLDGHDSDYFAQKTTLEAIQKGETPISAIGQNGYIAYPSGGYFSAQTNVQGKIRITLPVSWTATMLKFKVSIFNYSNHASVDYIISGYNYTGNSGYWGSCTALCLGAKSSVISNLPVNFAHDGTKCVITIGNYNTVFEYPKITISDVSFGAYKSDYETWSKNWSISITSDNTDLIVTKTIENPLIMSDYLPLDGSKAMTGQLQLTNNNGKVGADGNHAYLQANKSQDNTQYRRLILYNSGYQSDIKQALKLLDSVTSTNYNVLHTGNSAPVIISSTAPSDTTALWIDIS